MVERRNTRDRGIEFGAFAVVLAECDYPVTSAEIVERYGDHELEHARGCTRIAAVLGPIDGTFRSRREVMETVVGTIDMGAVGRKRYSDRGGTTSEERDWRPVDSL